MIRKIIHIDESKCTGCGLCADACHEGAIEIVNGKAKLTREDFCDGFGDCLPNCPEGAITFEEREAPAYDAAAVKAAQEKKAAPKSGCPGKRVELFETPVERKYAPADPSKPSSQLVQWPCQIKLMPVEADYYQGAKLLIAADCTAFACGSFHQDYMRGKITVIGCPKLDAVDYSEKLTEIIAKNDIKSVTILRMEVPCCGGLQHAAETALKNSGKFIPWQVVTLSRDGRVLEA